MAMIAGQMGTPGNASYLADSVVYLRFFEHAGKVKKAISVHHPLAAVGRRR